MQYKMELFALIICAIPAIVTSITISSNGNSPELKMVGGMMVDPAPNNIASTTPKIEDYSIQTNYEISRQVKPNATNLTINERYRRLIPYMTFYYANDLAGPTTDSSKSVEVEKAEIVEAKDMELHNQRQPKKILYPPQRTIPRYQGNRLTQFNIASANPTKVFYKDGVPVVHQNPSKVSPNFNPLQPGYVLVSHNYDSTRFSSKLVPKNQIIHIAPTTRKPYINLYKSEESPNIRYYFPEKDSAPKYKLVPYEQTPPVKVAPQVEKIQEEKKPYIVSVIVPKDHVYVKPRPTRPQFFYDNANVNYQPVQRKQPTIVSETYYEKERPVEILAQPVVESGFKPIVTPPEYTTKTPLYTSAPREAELGVQKQYSHVETVSEAPNSQYNPNYYNYVIEQPTYNQEEYKTSDTINIAELIKTLQLNRSIPKPITKENVGSSIRTLLQALNALKAIPQQNDVESPVISAPKPFVAPKILVQVTNKPLQEELVTPSAILQNEDYETIHDEPYLAPVKTPSQHLDDFPTGGSSSQQFPLPVTSDDEGGTPGQPGIDYPILTTIPQTSFNCKSQRYKGFFADTETRCQVWHYCDLNGGQASFLCPNGTIFSQAGLTCDWWFNVRCASTTQLYVLNESLYKYILPHSPKFPEDYSGPLVDKYLTLKFKEMEEQFKKNKSKQKSEDGSDSQEENDSDETDEDQESDSHFAAESNETSTVRTISAASVVIESPGNSGKVERLQI